MKQVNKLLISALVFSLAGFASAATNESAQEVFLDADNLLQAKKAALPFALAGPNAERIDRRVERRLSYQAYLAVEAMYEAPIYFEPLRIEIGL